MTFNLYSSKDTDVWSPAKIIDELQLCLITTFEKDNFNRKYLKKAEYLIYRIPLFRPIPPFEINISDLTPKLEKELASIDKNTLDYVMKESIGRLFEEINQEYFYLNVRKLLKWRFVK